MFVVYARDALDTSCPGMLAAKATSRRSFFGASSEARPWYLERVGQCILHAVSQSGSQDNSVTAKVPLALGGLGRRDYEYIAPPESFLHVAWRELLNAFLRFVVFSGGGGVLLDRMRSMCLPAHLEHPFHSVGGHVVARLAVALAMMFEELRPLP